MTTEQTTHVAMPCTADELLAIWRRCEEKRWYFEPGRRRVLWASEAREFFDDLQRLVEHIAVTDPEINAQLCAQDVPTSGEGEGA